MNEIEIFQSPEFGQVRTTVISGEPWFVAADVCRALDVSNSRMAMSRLDDDEKGVSSTDTLGGKQDMQIINEPGLYALVLGSRKPEDIALMVSSAMYYFVDLFDNHQKAEQALMRCYWLCRDKGQFTEGEDVVRG